MEKRIGIIGFGNMGSVIGERIKAKYEIYVFDKDKNKTQNLLGIEVAADNIDLVEKAEVVILAVKPQDFSIVLEEIKNYTMNKLIISIAAGISTDFISKYLPYSRIIRAMPNLLAKIGEGTTFLYKGQSATSGDLSFAEELFKNLGKIWIIEEKMMNFATAASGTAPALSCYFIETHSINYHSMSEEEKRDLIEYLEKGAKAVGFSQQDARVLAEDIADGVIHMLNKIEGLSPSKLREQVTSKGGTTAAALEVLHAGGSIEEAFQAAVKRAEELAK